MVLPQWFVKEVLTEFYDGPAGGHLRMMKSSRKVNARFEDLFGLAKAVYRY